MTKESITVRIDPSLRSRIDEAFGKLPYKPTLTAIIERGINLAINEAEAHVERPVFRASITDRQYLEKIADQVIARNHSKTVTSREATPAVETVSGKRGADTVAIVCPALIDDVGGQ